MTPPTSDPSHFLLDSLRRVAPYAVASGLTPLIPVPFLDDYALRQVRERMVREFLHARALSATPDTVARLAGRHPRQGSRLQQFLGKAALLPLRLASRHGYRRLLTALWVKDCVDMASISLHHGYLLGYALERGDLTEASLRSPDAAGQIHATIAAACAEVDARPVNQALRRLLAGSRLVLEALGRTLDDWTGVTPTDAAPAAPAPASSPAHDAADAGERASLAEQLAATLWEQEGYFRALETRYDRLLGPRRPPGATEH